MSTEVKLWVASVFFACSVGLIVLVVSGVAWGWNVSGEFPTPCCRHSHGQCIDLRPLRIQIDFMNKDECILVDFNDNVAGEFLLPLIRFSTRLVDHRLCAVRPRADRRIMAGHDNKYETHIFCPERPRGKLHRAFSVFLFDEHGRLLLQQRAKEKVGTGNTLLKLRHAVNNHDPSKQEAALPRAAERICCCH